MEGSEDPDQAGGPAFWVRPGTIGLYVGPAPTRSERDVDAARIARLLGLPEGDLAVYVGSDQDACVGPPSVCEFADDDGPVEGDMTKLVVHEPTGLTVFNEVRAGERLVNRFEVVSLEAPFANAQ